MDKLIKKFDGILSCLYPDACGIDCAEEAKKIAVRYAVDFLSAHTSQSIPENIYEDAEAMFDEFLENYFRYE